MTSQISKALASAVSRRMTILVLLVVSLLSLHAQQSQPTMEQQLAALQRLEAMQPDSILPKYQQAVLLLGTVCEQPQSSKAQQYIDEAQRVIQRIEALQPTKATDRSRPRHAPRLLLHSHHRDQPTAKRTALLPSSPRQLRRGAEAQPKERVSPDAFRKVQGRDGQELKPVRPPLQMITAFANAN